MQKSIRSLHTRIGFTLKWSGVIFILANAVFLLLFILTDFMDLHNSSILWKGYFLNRIQGVEKMMDGSPGALSIPIVHRMTIEADGVISQSPTPVLQGLRLNRSGFFGKIAALQSGQKAIIFFPDMVDGIQRVHFVKRFKDQFVVYSFEAKEFFPIPQVDQTVVDVVTGNIVWFSSDADHIGDVYDQSLVYIEAARLFIALSDQIPEMPESRLVITLDITAKMLILAAAALLLTLVFGGISLRTLRVQQEFASLQNEQASMMQFIRSLLAIIPHPDETTPARLEDLSPHLHQFLENFDKAPLQFEENDQYQGLVQKFAQDMLILINMINDEKNKLCESEERFRALSANALAGVYVIQDGVIVYANQALGQMFGYERADDIIGLSPIELVKQEDRDLVLESMRQRIEGIVDTAQYEFRGLHKNGEIRSVEVLGARTQLNNRPAIIGNALDITERKQADEMLRETLNERETLLREIHHRVKNNLQVMMSLINMRIGLVQDQSMRQFLKELVEQVRSMSLIYEQLYQEKNLSRVNMGSYLNQLTSNLLGAFGRHHTIQVNLDGDIFLDVVHAIPCGMIVNELFTNSLKYAFPPGYAGTPVVSIRLQRDEDACRLAVADNGVGLPDGFDWRTSKSMGARLVNLWATHQLGGTLDVSSSPKTGTSYQIFFYFKR